MQIPIINMNEVHLVPENSNVHVNYPLPQGATENHHFAYYMENPQDTRPIADTDTPQDWNPAT